MTQELAIEAIKNMPKTEFDLDALFERLVFIEEIESARREIRDGKTIHIEEVKKIVSEWRK